MDRMRFDANVAASPVLDEHGNTAALLCIISDITEQKELREQLLSQSQAFAEVSTPVITPWERIVLLPVAGTMDDDRAAQTLAQLGVDFQSLRTKGNLRAGVEAAFELVGSSIVNRKGRRQ